MGLETFLKKRPEVDTRTVYSAKTFHQVFTVVDHVHITSRLLYDKTFCTMLFSIDVHWNTPPWHWRNCLLDVFKCSLKIVLRWLAVRMPFLWHSESSSAVRWLLHADWMMLKNSSNQGVENSVTLAPWQTKSWPRLLVYSKALFLENYLAVSTWILNGSSIECLEKKYQPFSLAGVWFGSLVNQIFGLKSAWRRSGLCLTLLLCNCCCKWVLRNNPRNQTNIFRLNVTLTMPRSQSWIIKSFLQGKRIKIRSTIDQRPWNTRLSCPPTTLLQLYSCLLCYEICNRISRIIEWIFFHGIKAGKFNSVFN